MRSGVRGEKYRSDDEIILVDLGGSPGANGPNAGVVIGIPAYRLMIINYVLFKMG